MQTLNKAMNNGHGFGQVSLVAGTMWVVLQGRQDEDQFVVGGLDGDEWRVE
jgi:hypothetical protein